MNKLFFIIKKNFLILVKSRWWTLIIVLGPLLMIFLTGIAFDNLNEYRINIGVYSQNYTEVTDSFISKLNSNQFRTIKAKSESECIDDAKFGLSHTCVIFPANLYLGAANKNILIYIDYSKLNLAWIIRDRLFSRVTERSTEITRALTENLLSKLLLTRNEIDSDIITAGFVVANEDLIINNTNVTFYLISSINTTVGLSASDIDRLQSKINSIKTAFDTQTLQAEGSADYSEDLINGGPFSEDEKNNLLDDIGTQRERIAEQKVYVYSLFDPKFSSSISNTMLNVRYQVELINLNANSTSFLVMESKQALYNTSQLTASNAKSLKKIESSLSSVQRELRSIDELTAEDIASPVVADIKPLTEYNTYLNYMFPTLMAMSIMLAALLLSAIVVVMELNSPAFFRNFISPTSDFMFFFTSYLTNLSLIGTQTLIMILISIIFFFSQVISNILTTIIVCFVVSTFFILMGMGIGYLFRTEQMSILATTFSASLLLFLSNILMPIENMPEFFMNIVQFNPFIVSVSLLRKSILFRQSLININQELLYLVMFIIGLLIIYSAVYFIRSKEFQNKSVIKQIFKK